MALPAPQVQWLFCTLVCSSTSVPPFTRTAPPSLLPEKPSLSTSLLSVSGAPAATTNMPVAFPPLSVTLLAPSIVSPAASLTPILPKPLVNTMVPATLNVMRSLPLPAAQSAEPSVLLKVALSTASRSEHFPLVTHSSLSVVTTMLLACTGTASANKPHASVASASASKLAGTSRRVCSVPMAIKPPPRS